jgi:NAD-dependent deacetylase
LTGAGISAESGIPTFRGPEGYWTVGSREYHPQEMATYEMFVHNPEEVWKWYL